MTTISSPISNQNFLKTTALATATIKPKPKRFDINASRRQVSPRRQFKAAGGDGGGDEEEPAPEKPPRLLSKKQVLERIPLSFVTIWKLMNAGTFPKSRSIADNRTVWLESEIDQWILETPERALKGSKVAGV